MQACSAWLVPPLSWSMSGCVCMCVYAHVWTSAYSSNCLAALFKAASIRNSILVGKKTTSSSNDASVVFPIVKKVFRSAEILLLYYYSLKDGFPMKTQLFGQMQWCLTVAPTVSFAPVTHNSPILPHMDCCEDHNHVALKSMDRCHFFYRANAVKSRFWSETINFF